MNLENVISHPDKVFWPDEGYTKLDVAKFYETVFPRLKPYIKDRLLTMERCPMECSANVFIRRRLPKASRTARLRNGSITKAVMWTTW